MGGAPAVAPGLLIAERYRVEEKLSGDTGATRVGQLWRAHDEVLARQVALLLMPDDDPGVPEVLAGARAAARLTHAAVIRVYDAGEAPGLAFVVTEFLSGGSLESQLLAAPLEPALAVDLVAELAIGVAAAHQVGLHGLSLTPSRVLFTATGAPRLVGIGLAGHIGDAEDAQTPAAADEGAARARLDAVGLARLLYAALTGRWPGPTSDSALLSAPYAEGRLCTPRQVRGGVPREVDAVVAQALGDELLLRGLPAISSPAQFAAALEPLRTPAETSHPYGADARPADDPDNRIGRRGGPVLPSARRWRLWALVIAVLLLAVAVWGLTVSRSPGYLRFVRGAPPPTTTPTPTPTRTTGATAGVDLGGLVPRSISEFDPYGDHTDPHVTEAPKATDGDLTTAWRTQVYKAAALGNLKPGVGLLVDLGSSRKVSSVHLHLLGTGSSVTLFDSDGATAPANDKAMSLAATQVNAPSDVTLKLSSTTSARYWVVWLTRLPATPTGFQGGVAELTFLP